MNHPLHEYLSRQLCDLLHKRSVVVFYDPRSEFLPYFGQELSEVGTGYEDLPRVFIEEQLVFLARYAGSFFGLRAAVESLVAEDQPDPLIVYLPGVVRDRQQSVLMELEKGGTCYEPQLKRLGLNVLRKRFTDGQVDEMLRPASVTYGDIVSFLQQAAEGEKASVLRAIFGGVSSETLLTRWLADASTDDVVSTKEAVPELLRLIETRLGLSIAAGSSTSEARDKTVRYLLVNEFLSDLCCNAPTSVAMVPEPPSAEHSERMRTVTDGLRRTHADCYVELADKAEKELGLVDADVSPSDLGSVDTFRFEERTLLGRAGELIAAKEYEAALSIVADRSRSFWVDRDVSRQSQWEACRLTADLGAATEGVRPAVSAMGTDVARWVAAYVIDGGWSEIDQLQRSLETWVSNMDNDPECDKALAVVRREHEELLKRMASGFSQALERACWMVPGVMQQTNVYPTVVQKMGGRAAYFVVDALRFEMGLELARHLQGAADLSVQPAIAALPSITPVGMAALLPGASSSFSVVEESGRIAARIEGTTMPTLSERLKLLQAMVPDVVELTLGKLLGSSTAKLEKTIGDASLVLVRSQEIDFIGEADGDFLARQVMDGIIGNLARAVKKLAGAGIENFVITSDHGHQFSVRKDEDMRTDSPRGDTVLLHRRCWVGRGGTTPSGTVRVTGAELGYDTDLDFVFPTGLGVFKAGGSLSFHHGGMSLQELIIPVVSLRLPRSESSAPSGKKVVLGGLPDKISNRTFGIRVRPVADLLSTEPVMLRVILVCGGEQVGHAGMAVDAQLDRSSGLLYIDPGADASVAMVLTRDDCSTVRVIVQDPATDAVLDQSDELPVKLGM